MAAVAAASGMLLTAQFPLPSAPIIALILLHVVTHRSDDGTVCVRHQLSQQESNTHTHTNNASLSMPALVLNEGRCS